MVYRDELYHWGIKGMKWGVRRYQNKDGTLTSEGKKHYSQDHEDYTRAHTSKLQKAIKIAGATATALGTVTTLYNNGSNAMKLGKSIVESGAFKNAVVGCALTATMKAHGA